MFRTVTGRDIRGLLGTPFFVSYIIQIDFDARELRIPPKSTAPSPSWGKLIEVGFSETNTPVLNARFATYDEEPCYIDTGYSGTVRLRSDVFEYLSETGHIEPLGDTAFASVASENNRTQKGSLSEFQLATKAHKNLLVTEGNAESLIGLAYLRRYLVTFDLAQGRIYLAPGFDFERPEHPILGIGILRRGKTAIVVSVEPGSAAFEAGFQVDDELISVDGEKVEEKPSSEIKWMLQTKAKSNDGANATVRRQGAFQTLNLLLHRPPAG